MAVARAALLLACLAATADAAPGILLRYDVRWGPLRLLTMETTLQLGTSTYRTSTRLETVGLLDTVFPWRAESSTEGLRSPLRPRRHRSDGRFRGEIRTVEIAYADDGAVQARVEPPSTEEAREIVPEALRQGTVDPLTATLAALDGGCRGTVPVFDGRRRYDLRLEDRGAATVETGRGMYDGPAQRCHAVVAPLGGFWRDDPREAATPTTLDLFMATPDPTLSPVPVYIELAGQRGTLRIQLVALEAQPG
jgi:hypothetical protein